MNSTSEHRCSKEANEEEPLLVQGKTELITQQAQPEQQTGAIPKIKIPSVQKKDKISGKNKDESATHIITKGTMSKDEQKPKTVLKLFRYFKSFKVKKIYKNCGNYKIVANGDFNEDIASNQEIAKNAEFCEKKDEDLNDRLKFEGSIEEGKEYQLRENIDHNELNEEMNDLMEHENHFCDLDMEKERMIRNLERHRNLIFEPLPTLPELSEEDSEEENENATCRTKSGSFDQFDVTVENNAYKKVMGRNEPKETVSPNANVKPVVTVSLCQRCGETALINQFKYDLERRSRSGEPVFVDIPLYHYLQICGVFEKVDLEKLKENVNSKEFEPNPFEIYIERFLTIRKLCSTSHKTIWIAFDSRSCKFVFMEYYVQKDLKVNADELISTVEINVPSWECDLKILCEFVTCFNILFDDYILRCIVRAPVDKGIFEEIGHLPATFNKTS